MDDAQELSVNLSHHLMAATKGIFKHIWVSEELEGLTGPQFGIMVHLHKNGPMNPSELSDRMSVTAGNITGMIARLKKLGYVKHHRMTSDRRCLRIALSPEGHLKVEKVLPIWRERVHECFSPLPEAEKRQLITLLAHLCESLNIPVCSPFQQKDRNA